MKFMFISAGIVVPAVLSHNQFNLKKKEYELRVAHIIFELELIYST